MTELVKKIRFVCKLFISFICSGVYTPLFRAKLDPQICKNPAQGTVPGLPKQMGELNCAAPARLPRIIDNYGYFHYQRVLLFSVPCGFYSTPGFCSCSLVCSVEEPHNILAAPHCLPMPPRFVYVAI
jgi:hypothetical protein